MIPYKFNYNLDHPLRSIEHKNILFKKRVLREIYTGWYKVFKNFVVENENYVELGSGGGFIKEIIPNIITSDLNEIPGIDLFFSAEKMPFENNSLSGIFMIDAFHHFPHVKDFFNEAQRCLRNKGKVVMIEPWNTRWARFVYKNFHHELFDQTLDWTFNTTGPLSGSNMALPYIVFNRDKKKFQDLFPKLKVLEVIPHTPFSYILTGGFSRKAFLPYFFFPIIKRIEQLQWLKNSFAMFVTIVIEKND